MKQILHNLSKGTTVTVDVDFRNGIIKLFDEHFSTHEYSNVVVLKGSVRERLQTIKETLKLKGLDISI